MQIDYKEGIDTPPQSLLLTSSRSDAEVKNQSSFSHPDLDFPFLLNVFANESEFFTPRVNLRQHQLASLTFVSK